MRVSIQFDSASTEQVRQLAVALHKVGLTETLNVGVNGPEKWSGHTGKLTPNQFASVVASIVKVDGETIAAFVNERK
jgi:hypothetical protein